MGSVGSR